jgi:hypothetical protein
MQKPLSCVEHGVSRGSKKQYSQPGSCLKNKLKFGLTDSKKVKGNDEFPNFKFSQKSLRSKKPVELLMDQLSKFSQRSTKVSNIFVLIIISIMQDLHLLFRKNRRYIVLESVERDLSFLV